MMDYIYHFMNKLREKISDFDMNIKEETKTSFIFNNGGSLHSLPNSANTIRGFKADDIYIDEFAHFTNNTDREIIEAITPSLTRGGNIYYISTPFGSQNLFYDYWHNKDMKRILINWKDCPDFKSETIEQIKQTLGEDAFQQEYNNQFLSDIEGQEFPFELIQRCIDPELEYNDLEKKKTYLGGADIGRKQDLTAFIAIEKQDNKYIVRNKKIMREMPYDEQSNFFTYMLNNFTFSKFHMDESGIGNMMAEQLSRGHRITPITFNNENKQEMVSNLKRLMQEGNLLFPDDPQMINNIRSIRRIYTSTNYLRYDSERDDQIGHADLFWALCLALYDESKRRTFIMPAFTKF